MLRGSQFDLRGGVCGVDLNAQWETHEVTTKTNEKTLQNFEFDRFFSCVQFIPK